MEKCPEAKHEHDNERREDENPTDFEAGELVDELPPDPDAERSAKEKMEIDRKLVQRLDIKLIPWLCLLYLACFLDRTNIGNAKIDGLLKDTKISDSQYDACLTIFFISYAIFEPLTNILLKRLRPSIFIPTIMILWGICLTTMGLVHNFSGLMAARWWLGFTEAGFYPGINYYFSCWYKRSELGLRAAVFFAAAAAAGSFGGLLAAAIVQMDGVGGKPGWAWIFILEGLATVVLGFVSFWMVYDFPDEAKFLSHDDRLRVIRRLKLDNQSSAEREGFKISYLWAALQDWKMYTNMVIFMGCDGALYAFSLFLPTIISGMGYSSTIAQLLSVPPYAAAALLTIIVGFVADRTRQRGIYNILCSLLGIAGFAMLLGSGRPSVQYAGTFLGALGIYPCIANSVSWASNNFEGVYKRGVALGFIIGWGNLNGIMSSNIYRAEDKPRYKLGHGTVLAYETLFLFGGSVTQYILLRRENKKRKEGKRDHWIEGKSKKEIEMLGDKRPDFIYTI